MAAARKRKAEAAEGARDKPGHGNRKCSGVSEEDAVALALRSIPRGQTRSKIEVFRAVLEHLGRGDEAILTGTRTKLGAILGSLSTKRKAGWHRVVGSDGSFWPGQAAAQLKALRAEGARPRSSEKAAAWAKRIGARFVGCYRPTKGVRRCWASTEVSLSRLEPRLLEPLIDEKHLAKRKESSSGKFFWRYGEEKSFGPPFKATARRLKRSRKADLAGRLRKLLTKSKLSALQSNGLTLLRRVLQPEHCEELLRFAESADFTDVTLLDGEAGCGGRYAFCRELPGLLQELRCGLYERLIELSPELGEKYGKDLGELEDRCTKAGQTRPATIFLAYGNGGYNLAHQDPYGSVFFPYQAALLLSRRGKDFEGGNFFVKNVATKTCSDVDPSEGDVVLFAANKWAVGGQDFLHGLRTLKPAKSGRCERFAVGVVFNLRR